MRGGFGRVVRGSIKLNTTGHVVEKAHIETIRHKLKVLETMQKMQFTETEPQGKEHHGKV